MPEATKKAVKKPAPAHPPYIEMIKAAITALKERNGSSRQQILKYIEGNNKVGDNAAKQVKLALRRGVEKGSLIHTKGKGASGSFKVVPKEASKPKKDKTVKSKPKKATKPKPKKSPAKKSTKAKAASKSPKKPATKSKAKKPKAKTTTKKSPAKKASKAKSPKKPAAKKAPKKTAAKK